MSQPKGSPPSGSPKNNDSPPSSSKEDVAIICRVSQDRRSAEVIRKRGDQLEVGSVRPLEEGKPIQGEVVRLKPRAEAPFVCDVEVQYDPGDQAMGRMGAGHSGPAQVATDSYRRGWDAVYKDRSEPPTTKALPLGTSGVGPTQNKKSLN